MDITYAYTENPHIHPNTMTQVAVNREYTLRNISGINKITNRMKLEKCVRIICGICSKIWRVVK